MHILIALALAVLVGIIAFVLLDIFPPTKRYASILSLVVAILVFLIEIGAVQ